MHTVYALHKPLYALPTHCTLQRGAVSETKIPDAAHSMPFNQESCSQDGW